MFCRPGFPAHRDPPYPAVARLGRWADLHQHTQPAVGSLGELHASAGRLGTASNDVQAQPAPAGAGLAAAHHLRPRESRAVVLDDQQGAAVRAGSSRTSIATPSGVCAKTFPRMASTATARSACVRRTGIGLSGISTVIARSVSSARTNQNAARSPTTAPASQAAAMPSAHRSPSLGDELVDAARQLLDVSGQPFTLLGVVQLVGIEPERGDRGSEAV